MQIADVDAWHNLGKQKALAHCPPPPSEHLITTLSYLHPAWPVSMTQQTGVQSMCLCTVVHRGGSRSMSGSGGRGGVVVGGRTHTDTHTELCSSWPGVAAAKEACKYGFGGAVMWGIRWLSIAIGSAARPLSYNRGRPHRWDQFRTVHRPDFCMKELSVWQKNILLWCPFSSSSAFPTMSHSCPLTSALLYINQYSVSHEQHRNVAYYLPYFSRFCPPLF